MNFEDMESEMGQSVTNAAMEAISNSDGIFELDAVPVVRTVEKPVEEPVETTTSATEGTFSYVKILMASLTLVRIA